MKLMIKKDRTSYTDYIFIQDSTSASGAGLTGLVYNSAGLTAYQVRQGGSAASITLATLSAANSAWSSGGFKEVDATNMPGVYRLDIPDAVLATGVDNVVLLLKGATNMVPIALQIQLVAIDLQDAVRMGQTALPNAAAGASGGLPLSVDASGRVDVLKINGTSQTAGDLAAMITVVDDYVDTEVTAIKAKTDNLPSDPADASDIASSFSSIASTLSTIVSTLSTIASYIDTEVTAIKAKTDNLPGSPAATSDIPSAATIAVAVWDSLVSTLTTVTSIGKLLVDNIDAAISSRLLGSSYVAPDNTTIGAINAKTINLPSNPADQSLVIAATDAVMTRLGAPAGASLSADIQAVNAKTANIPAAPAAVSDIPSAASIASAVMASTVELDAGSDPVTVKHSLQISNAVNAGKDNGMAGTTVHMRNIADSKNRVTATVDTDNNRTATTLDLD